MNQNKINGIIENIEKEKINPRTDLAFFDYIMFLRKKCAENGLSPLFMPVERNLRTLFKVLNQMKCGMEFFTLNNNVKFFNIVNELENEIIKTEKKMKECNIL